ncbi:hypothetical protein JCM7686_pAMI5p054 (plasmid) [Paracoccus aminophilus JCM 7686]|uniref:Uncharacterized protein n=1 Tax=Paracoccus aminophilus JCM 7686 TaxID=1367847 RepID=S5Y635_PARAH|nr:hypothetical protein JCM7686_pAMI5p054 [Paracoccus aminophilus JCM 7686]
MRDPETKRGSREVALYADVVAPRRAAGCPAPINLTAGVSAELSSGPIGLYSPRLRAM